MKPSPSRLICGAPNRFVPSIALWQHFIGPSQHFQSQQRLSSTATEVAQGVASSNNGIVPSQEASTLSQLESEIGQPSSEWKVRRPTTARGNWYPNKRDASIAKNKRQKVIAHDESLSASVRLLAAARAASDAGKDYEGVVVQPIADPVGVLEENLPWSLPKVEMTMSGLDRYSATPLETGLER